MTLEKFSLSISITPSSTEVVCRYVRLLTVCLAPPSVIKVCSAGTDSLEFESVLVFSPETLEITNIAVSEYAFALSSHPLDSYQFLEASY